jgi:hypothetical protein
MAGAAAGTALPPQPQQGASQPQAGSAQQGASQPQAGSQQDDSQPQAGSQQPLSQPLSQQLLFLLQRLPNSLSRRQVCFFLAHGSQQLSQAGASQPQAGSQQDDSQPQAGSQQAEDSQPQAGSQQLSQLSQLLPHPPHPLPPKSFDSNPLQQLFLAQGSQQESHAGASQPHAGSQQDDVSQPQAGSQQAGASQPQAGSAQQDGSAKQEFASQPQAGSQQAEDSQPHAGSQHEGVSQQPVSQLLALPQHFTPSIRSNRSNPKLWLQILQPRTRAIVIIVRFIGATSPLSQFGGSVCRDV